VVERQGEEWVGVSRSRVERSLARHGFSLGDATRPQQLRPIARSWVLPGSALGGLGLLVSVVLLVLERRSSARAHEQAQQFVLHALTHELRSPATASRLALEQLRPHYDLLPEDAAEAFLALTRANTRLNRTLAETGTLLSLRSGHCPVQPAACALQDVFDELGEDVETDVTLHTDPQLLALVLGNVLANAHRHGAPPVTVQAARTSKGARIVIGDAGEWRQPLADVLNPFARDSEQDGLGLGLALMDHGVALLGGRWTLDYTPTRFTLLLPDLAS
jgi:signal transduction histidine kinase